MEEIATVTEIMPGLYRLKLSDQREVLAYPSGKMKQSRIKLLINDRVKVILDPYGGKATNRIVWRM